MAATLEEYLFGADLAIMWLIAALFLIIGSFLFIRRASKSDTLPQKRLNWGYFWFINLYGVTRICFLFSDFYQNSSLPGAQDLFALWTYIAYIPAAAGLFLMFLHIEKDFIPTKNLFTILCAILVVLDVAVWDYDIRRYLMYVAQPFYLIAVLYFYIYIFRNSVGTVRRKALLVIIALIVFFTGVIFDIEALNFVPIPLWIDPTLVIVGIFMFIYFQRLKKETFQTRN